MVVSRDATMTLFLQSEGGDYCECADGPLVDVDDVSGLVLLFLLSKYFSASRQVERQVLLSEARVSSLENGILDLLKEAFMWSLCLFFWPATDMTGAFSQLLAVQKSSWEAVLRRPDSMS